MAQDVKTDTPAPTQAQPQTQPQARTRDTQARDTQPRDTQPRQRSEGQGRRRQQGNREQGSREQQPRAQSGNQAGNQTGTPEARNTDSRSPQAHSPQAQSNEARTADPNNQRRRRNRRRPPQQTPTPRPGQVTNTTAVPVVAAPSKRGQKRALVMPRIGVGCVILKGDEILLVRERGRWSLPKGGLESGELVQDGARRETFEETGLVVELRDLAFVVEFQSDSWGHHLQFFYTARVVGGELEPRDPDRDVQEARFIPLRQLREFIRFRPRLVALETWLRERRPRHFTFNLDHEPAMLRRRRRVGEGGVVVAPEPEADGEPDL